MPKYVAKEDVEKGLVDPKRSLDEQPEYKQKIEKQQEQKEKQHEGKQTRQRPKKERPPRKQRPKFNWNKKEITLETKVPEQPKKLIQKPDAQKHREGFQKLKAEREALKTQRQKLIDEQRLIIKDINESKRNGREVNTQYNGVMREKMNLENQCRKQIRAIDDQKKKIYSQIESLRNEMNEYIRPSSNKGFSMEVLQNKIVEKEHQLTTSNINKREEAKLTNEINELKRALSAARPHIEIQSKVGKLNDQIQLLQQELAPIKRELHVRITHANEIKEEIIILKKQLSTEKGAVEEKKPIEDIKAEFDVKLKAVEDKRDKLQQKIDDYMDKHTRAMDEFEDQQDLLRYINWVQDQIEWLKKKKEEEAEREKKRLEQEKRRQKEKEDYEKRQEERKRRDEERKKNEEERKQRLEKEKEQFLNRNPNYQIIDQCHTLIDYCQSLKPTAVFKYEDSRTKAPAELNFDKAWQKDLKNGAQVVVPKKANKDEQVKKPAKVVKKKEQKPEDETFEHGIEVINQFQAIKLLPPNNATEIDSSINLIKDKIEFYNNPTEEDKVAFRQKAIKEWQERQAPRERKQGNYRQKREDNREDRTEEAPKKEKREHQKKGKKNEIKEGDFPELA